MNLSGHKGNDDNSTGGSDENDNSVGIISDLELLSAHYKHLLWELEAKHSVVKNQMFEIESRLLKSISDPELSQALKLKVCSEFWHSK